MYGSGIVAAPVNRTPSPVRWGLIARVQAAAVPFPLVSASGAIKQNPGLIAR